MKNLIILATLVILTGCESFGDAVEGVTHARPYAEVGIGWQLDANTDPLRRTTNSNECRHNLPAHFEGGLDWGNTSLGYEHRSWFFCGEPFNNEAETYADTIWLRHRFGGK